MSLSTRTSVLALQPIGVLTAAMACIVVAATLIRLDAQAQGPVPHTMQCRLGAHTAQGTEIVLVNTTAGALARGAAVAWAGSEEPRIQGEVRRLPHPLARGESVVIRTRLVLGDSVSCMASALLDPEHLH